MTTGDTVGHGLFKFQRAWLGVSSTQTSIGHVGRSREMERETGKNSRDTEKEEYLKDSNRGRDRGSQRESSRETVGDDRLNSEMTQIKTV